MQQQKNCGSGNLLIYGRKIAGGTAVELYLVAVILISIISCFNNQYNATNLNQITANSQLAAELGPAQPQLVFTKP